MRRVGLFLSLLTVPGLACAKPPTEPEQQAQSEGRAQARAGGGGQDKKVAPEWKPKRRKPEIVRKDLLATDLPAPTRLELVTPQQRAEGKFAYPEGTDELAPRAAIELSGGLALLGQAYLRRRPGRPPATWRWIGVVPEAGEATSTTLGEGAIRATIPSAEGGAMVVGSRGTDDTIRGWFAVLDGRGQVTLERDLDSPSATEMFALVAGRDANELAVVAGYVDAQGWLVSLGSSGERRWQKFVSSFGYTQIRGLARLDGEAGDLLALGARAQGFGDAWWSQIPGDGGGDASPAGVAQDVVEIAGADEHQLLRAVVDVGEAGFIALGTARRNHLQAHDQLILVGFDRAGAVAWSRVVPEVRAVAVHGGQAQSGAAVFVLEVPLDEQAERKALAVLRASPGAQGESIARELEGTAGLHGVPLSETDGAGRELVAYRQSKQGLSWRVLSVP